MNERIDFAPISFDHGSFKKLPVSPQNTTDLRLDFYEGGCSNDGD